MVILAVFCTVTGPVLIWLMGKVKSDRKSDLELEKALTQGHETWEQGALVASISVSLSLE
jgi:hypothetical protein